MFTGACTPAFFFAYLFACPFAFVLCRCRGVGIYVRRGWRKVKRVVLVALGRIEKKYHAPPMAYTAGAVRSCPRVLRLQTAGRGTAQLWPALCRQSTQALQVKVLGRTRLYSYYITINTAEPIGTCLVRSTSMLFSVCRNR